MVTKNKIFALIFGALIISVNGNAFAYTPIGQDYHEPTTKEEIIAYEKEDLPQLKKELNLQKSPLLEEKIKAPLVKYNPDKLKVAKSKYDDGLRDVFITGSDASKGEGGASFSGYIYIEYSSVASAIPQFYKTGKINDYNIYGLSVLACTYGHEAGHWYYDDSWRKAGQKKETGNDSKKMEARADKFALQVVDNVPNFSVGGDLIHWNYGNWLNQSNTHPSHRERWIETYNYIKQNSNGRVFFENDEHNTSHLIISNQGYDFQAYPPHQYHPEMILDEIEKENKSYLIKDWERASYVAGQVAWAIKNNAWTTNSVKFVDAHQYFKDLPANVNATVIIASKGSKYKIIDWYFSEEYLTEKQKKALNDYLICLKASMDESDFLKAVKK